MGYDFTVKGYYRVKTDKEYPWPCASLPDRKLLIFADDVLNKRAPGVYDKITGLGTMNHQIPDEDVEFVEDERRLSMRGMFSGT